MNVGLQDLHSFKGPIGVGIGPFLGAKWSVLLVSTFTWDGASCLTCFK